MVLDSHDFDADSDDDPWWFSSDMSGSVAQWK